MLEWLIDVREMRLLDIPKDIDEEMQTDSHGEGHRVSMPPLGTPSSRYCYVASSLEAFGILAFGDFMDTSLRRHDWSVDNHVDLDGTKEGPDLMLISWVGRPREVCLCPDWIWPLWATFLSQKHGTGPFLKCYQRKSL